MKTKSKKNIYLIILIIFLIILDQIIKFTLPNENEGKINNLIEIISKDNSEILVDKNSNNKLTYITTDIVVLALVIRLMIVQKDTMNFKTKIALGLIVGGGLSNLIDRILKGGVINYIKISSWEHMPAINFASIIIAIGFILFVVNLAIYSLNNIMVDIDGQRLDVYICQIKSDISRSMVQKMIEQSKILVNGKKEKPSYKLKVGDNITIEYIKPQETKLKPQKIPIEIIYDDNDIIVVNKPKGLVVHPGNGNLDGTLANAILDICKDSLSGIGGEIRPGIVHRLDKDTSGLLIIAKNDKAHINMSNKIKNREVKKIYIALVKGVIQENEATISMPIARSKKDRKKMAVDKNGKEAITHFKVLKRYDKYTLLEVKIDTGRTHQIRVHMAEIGHPIVGDTVYSNGKNEFGVIGQCLHAKSLEFKHPITSKEMKLEAKLPEYFQDILQKLDMS